MNLSCYLAAPWFLLGLVLIPLLAWKLRPGVRRWQLTAWLALVLAAVGPVIVNHQGASKTLVLLPGQFAEQAPEILKAQPQAELKTFAGAPDEALAREGARLPDHGATVILHTDTVATPGALPAQAQLLNQRGIPVYLKLLPVTRPQETTLASLDAPLAVQPGEHTKLNLRILQPQDGDVSLKLLDDAGQEVAARQHALKAGQHDLSLTFQPSKAGVQHYALQLNGKTVRTLPVTVQKPYRVLCFGQPSDQVITSLFQKRIHWVPYRQGMDMGDYSLLLFLHGGIATLTPAEQQAVVQAVEKGTGVLLVTGRSIPFRREDVLPAFADLFPVRYSAKLQEKIPTTALIVIIDTSGSMGGVRMELAREVARLAINKLQSCDMAGIVEFHGNRRWAAPLQSATNTLELQRALNRLSPGGGTVILPAMEEAFNMLRNADTKLKHILVITDGGVETGDFESLIRKMGAHDITVSTVMVANRESTFLTQLALWGNGRYYKAESRFALPELNFRQTGKQQLPPYREGTFNISREKDTELLNAWPENIPVNGILESAIQPDGQLLLTAAGLPLLAKRAHQHADVAVFNSEWGGDWTARLAESEAAGGTLAALARTLPSPLKVRGGISVRNLSHGQNIHLRIDGADPMQEITLIMQTEPKAQDRAFRLLRAPDGAFHFRYQALPEGDYHMNLPQLDYQWVLTAPPKPIPFALQPDTTLVDDINRRSARLEPPVAAKAEIPLRPWFAALALLLGLAQVFFRRRARQVAAILAVVLLAGVTVRAGDFETAMIQAIRCDLNQDLTGAMKAYDQAARKAEILPDQKFARSMQLECARKHGKHQELLKTWEQVAPRDSVRQMLVLQERGAEDALSKARGRHPLTAAVHTALLQGNRPQAQALIQAEINRQKNNPEALLDLVTLAEHSAFYKLSEDMLKLAAQARPDQRWQARFRFLQLLRNRGESKRALALIGQWTQDRRPEQYPAGAIMGCADYCEQFGDPMAALRLYDLAGTEEAVIRGAMILEEEGHNKDAAQRWMNVAISSKNPMRAKQAADRVIQLAKLNNTLPQLCDITAKLADESPDKLIFHAKALAAAKQHDRLFKFLAQRKLTKMAIDFRIELGQYTEAVKLLFKMVGEHPEKQEEFLQRLTIIALDTKNKKLAETVLDKLLKTAKDPVAAREFAAGVHALMENYPKAIDFYDQCIKLKPEKFELHLLKAKALKQAGRKQEAIDFFAKHVDREENPELFGIMVDGLLTMEAPKPQLRKALQKVMERLEKHPDVIFYYRLADDLADELADWELQRTLLIRQLAVAPERRNIILRRLYQTSSKRAERDYELYFTRLLVRLDDVQSPELYKAMSRTLAENGAFQTAEQCMRTADEIEGSIQYRQELIDLSIDLRRLDDAWRINHELETLMPDAIDVKTRGAQIMELFGNSPQAAALNWRAIELLVPRSVQQHKVKGGSEARLRKTLLPIMAAFCNQAVVGNVDYLPAIEKKLSQADSPSQKRLWNDLRRRLLSLTTLPVYRGKITRRTTAKASRFKPYPRKKNNPMILAEDLLTLPPAEAQRRIAAYLKAHEKDNPQQAWMTLVNELTDEPSMAVTASLMEALEDIEFKPDLAIWDAAAPVALGLKHAYAEKMFKTNPASLTALALKAMADWEKGEPDTARELVPFAHKVFIDMHDYDRKALKLVREMNRVYISRPEEQPQAGRKALSQRLKELTETAVHPTKMGNKAILEALLLNRLGNYEEQTRVLCTMWSNGTSDTHVLDLLRETLKESQCWNIAAEALAKNPSGVADDRTVLLHAWILGRVLCRLGRGQEAIPYYGSLPRRLAERERVDNPKLPPEDRAFLLRRLLNDVARQSKRLTSLSYDPLALEDPNVKLPDIVRTVAGAKELLQYLLRGTPVTDQAFYPLLEGYMNLPVTPQDRAQAAGSQKTVYGLIMKMVTVPQALTDQEKNLLAQLANDPRLHPEMVILIAEHLPPEQRNIPLYNLGQRITTLYLYQNDTLDRLTAMVPDALPPHAKLVANMTERILHGEVKAFQALSCLRKNKAPLAEEIIRRIKARHRVIPMDADAALIFRSENLPQTCAIHILTTLGRIPNWKALLPYLEAPQRKQLLNTYADALDDAFRRGIVTEAIYRRHYEKLALADSARKALWLQRCQDHRQSR